MAKKSQSNVNLNAIQTHAVYNCAELLYSKNLKTPSKQDVLELIEFEKTSGKFDAAEQEILRKLYWAIFYQFEKYSAKINEIISKRIANDVKNPEIPFNSSIPKSIPQNEPLPYTDSISITDAENRIKLARFLATKRFELKSRTQALNFVDRLLKHDFLIQEVLSNLKPNDHAEFQHLFDLCANQNSKSEIVENPIKSQNSNEDPMEDKTPQQITDREKKYIELSEKIFDILRRNGIDITDDTDDFMLKLVTLQDFRRQTYQYIPFMQQYVVDKYCAEILKNELE